jgi:hypothetical protein
LEVREHVELRVVGVGDVHVVVIVAAPEEGLAAGDPLDVAGLDSAGAQQLEMLVAEVVADWADDVNGREEAGGEGEVHGRAAQHPLALAEGRADAVEGDRTDHGQRHGAAS